MSQRAHFLEVGGPREWTKLTVVAPAPAPITATLRLGHHVSVTGCHLTQSSQDLSETEALAVI